jgi:hypothetical protein
MRASYKKRSISKMRSKKKSKSKVRIPSSKGKLFGYHVDSLARDRRSLLKRLIRSRRATFSEIIKRLNVLVIYNKRKHPETSKKVKRDLDYIERHMSQYRLSPQRKSPRKKSRKRKSIKRKSYSKK